MPYILNKTNGTIISVVQDAALDNTTDLTFLGRNFAGYGEVQNENFLKLLENFSNSSAPEKPIEGQIWFNSSTKKLNVFDNNSWKSIANLEIKNTNPIGTKNFTIGDLWYDTVNVQLYAYNGTEFKLIGPLSGDDSKSGWKGSREYSTLDGANTPKYNLKAIVGELNDIVAVVSNEAYEILDPPIGTLQNFPIYEFQKSIKKGVTLIGADEVTGESYQNDIYFWGTAAHALNASTATTSNGLTFEIDNSTDASFVLPFLNTLTNTSVAYVDFGLTYNPLSKVIKTNFFDGIATSAYYADLAERYHADSVYDEGTVLVIGGINEVTVTHTRADISVIGPVSKNPAFMMNKDAGPNDTHPYIALRGRVMCKVIGPVKKGNLLVSSSYPGYAEVFKSTDNPCAVIGKSLENFEGAKGMIEIVV